MEPTLARAVAGQLMANALSTLTLTRSWVSERALARPVLAAFTSAHAFSIGAAVPTLAAVSRAAGAIVKAVPAAALVFLVALGAIGAWAGGASMVKPSAEVRFWGALAMAVTAGIGALVGKAV